MDLSKALHDLITSLTRKTMYYGCYRYRVLEQVGPLVSLQAVGNVEGLDDMLMLPKAHGFASVTEDLMPSAMVLVQFEGGDPGSPFIAHYLSGPPIARSIAIQSSETFTLNSGDITATAKDTAQVFADNRVELGGPTLVPVADGDLTDNNIGKLWLGLNAVCSVVGIPPLAPMKSVGSEKVYVTAGKGTAIDPH